MVAVNRTPVPLSITGGLPYSRRFRLINGTTVWPTLGDFEVRSQMREGQTVTSALLADLRLFMTPSLDDTDIIISLSMTGAETRALPKAGFYDIVISDIGTDDAQAVLVVPASPIAVGSLVTAPS